MGIFEFFNIASQKWLILSLFSAILLLSIAFLIFRKRIIGLWKGNELKILKIIIIALLVVQLLFVFTSKLTDDDRFHLHIGYMTSIGEKPYVDFFEHHMFGYYLFLSPIFHLFQSSFAVIVAARLLSFIFSIILLVFLYKTIKLYYDDKIALYACALTLLFREFTIFSWTIRADLISCALFMAGVYFLLSFNKFDNRKHLMLSSLIFFLSFFFLQKIIPFAFIAVAGIFVVRLVEKKRIIKEAAIFFSVFLLCLTAFFLLLVLYFSPVNLALVWKLIYSFNSIVALANPILHNLITISIINGFFFIMLLISLSKPKMIKKEIFVLLIALLPFILLTAYKRIIGPQYFIYFVPIFSIFAAIGFDIFKKRVNQTISFLVLFLVMTLIPLGAFAIDLERNNGLAKDAAELDSFKFTIGDSVPILDKGYFIFHKNYEYVDFPWDYSGFLSSLGIDKESDWNKIIEDKNILLIRPPESMKNFSNPCFESVGVSNLYRRTC